MKYLYVLLFSLTTLALCAQTKLVAYYPLNGNFQDFSGKSHHGIETSLSYDDDRNINPSGACFFTGSSGYAKVAASNDFNFGTNDSFTITFWMKAFTYGMYASVISKSEESDTSGFCLGFDLNGRFRFISNLIYPVFSAQQITLNSWQHIAVTYAQKTVKIYLNGSLNATGNVLTLNKNAYGLILGRMCNSKDNGSDFRGLLDEVKIYSTALTNTDISNVFATGIKTRNEELNSVLITPSLITRNQPIALTTKFNSDYQVNMVDILGHNVFTGKNTTRIETLNLKNGIYFIYCRPEELGIELMEVKKIVINN